MASNGVIVVVNLTRGRILAGDGRQARGPWQRFVGLLGRAALPTSAGLILAPCTGIHTLFMRFPLDLVYAQLDADDRSGGTVVRLQANLRPFRLAPARADLVVELPAGTIARTTTAVGDRIVLRPAGRSGVGR